MDRQKYYTPKQRDYISIGISIVVVIGSALVFSILSYVIIYVIGLSIEIPALGKTVTGAIFSAIGAVLGRNIIKKIKQYEERILKLEQEVEQLKKNNN